MSQKIITFEIVTPERVVFREEIRQITVPTTSGEVTILPEHIPLVSILKPGVLEIKKSDDTWEIISVSGGFLEVLRDKIVILADTAERAVELDEQRIEEARARAEEAKKNAINVDQMEFARIAAQLEKELARTRALNRWRKIKGFSK
ncbi:TPA: ATP synthase F1 subunit epsilon [Candidatus Falkowbacteria bacterium]|nr:MAG: ATP synthase epsilon chain [Candidatus Falkowbacteria bacterium GW2011_GWF2_43_32]HBA36369.1 ATP synthase F1 subunit epsilon [Candidatus Falkowbacteria bacterium]